MALDTVAALSAVLVLCVISGLADSQGFVHASDVWRDAGVSWTSLARSSLGFAVGIASYWVSIRFMNRIGLATADLQFLVWFLTTLVGVAVATGSVRRWTGVDLVVGAVVIAGLCWLSVKGTAGCEPLVDGVAGQRQGEQHGDRRDADRRQEWFRFNSRSARRQGRRRARR
jgi:hypothetical protein